MPPILKLFLFDSFGMPIKSRQIIKQLEEECINEKEIDINYSLIVLHKNRY